MKPPLLLCSAVTILALSACHTAPSDRSATLRRGKILVTPAAPCCETPAPASVPETASVVSVVSSEPVSMPAPIPVRPPEPPPAPVTPPAPVVVAPPPPPPTPAPATTTPSMKALRKGSVVHLSWTLPETAIGFRAIEIMRNTDSRPAGRSRIRAVRGSLTQIEDTLPDPAVDYWYWIKLTATDGTVSNLGPFATETAP